MMIFFKVCIWNKFSVELQIYDVICSIKIPCHCQVVYVRAFSPTVQCSLHLPLLSAMVYSRVDQAVTLKDAIQNETGDCQIVNVVGWVSFLISDFA